MTDRLDAQAIDDLRRERAAEAAVAERRLLRSPQTTAWRECDVVDVLPGAGEGGADLALIDLDGAQVAARHLAHWTPTKGHRVHVALSDRTPLIHGQIVSGPTQPSTRPPTTSA